MGKFKNFAFETALLLSATLGAGIFALPYVFYQSGWLLGLFYLLILGAAVIFTHHLYARVLEQHQEKNRLPGLVKIYFGRTIGRLSFLAVVGGLLLALLIYLVLAGQFAGLISSASLGGSRWVVIIFWLVSSVPIFLKIRPLAKLEFFGAAVLFFLIVLIFLTASNTETSFPVSARGESAFGGKLFDWRYFFLPFGPIIFALAGWTAIGPMLEWRKQSFASGANLSAEQGPAPPRFNFWPIFWGTALAMILYLVFTLGIFNSSGFIAQDTISGLANWPLWKLRILGWLGLFLLWTSYFPIGLEIKNSLEKDFNWPKILSGALVLFAPLTLFFLGLRNFLSLVGLAGGVFLSLQYLFIVLLGRRILVLSRWRRLLSDGLIAVFILAALYEIIVFIGY